MRVEGRHTVAANRETVWSVLYDPATLQSILPGCESFEAISSREFRITLRLRVGQIVDRFTGTLWLDAVVPLTGFDFQADGESGSGLIHGHGRVYLEGPAAADDATTLGYEADFDVDGPLRNATDRLLTTTARAFTRRTLEALEHQLDLRTRVYTTTVPSRALDAAAHTTAERLGAVRRLAAMLGILLVALFLRRMLARRCAEPGIESLALAVPLPAGGDALDRP